MYYSGSFKASLRAFSRSISKSSSTFSIELLNFANPEPAGINLPTTTFSFKPRNLSTLPVVAASVKTLVVSWKDAAEINDSVAKDALVIPSNNLLN